MARRLMRESVGGLAWLCAASSCLAGSVTLPGETLGATAGAPAPPGLYAIDTSTWGCRSTSRQSACLSATVPILVWSTPRKIAGGRLSLIVTDTTGVATNGKHGTNSVGFFNPYDGAQLAWDVGHGWGVSYMLGAYFDLGSATAFSSTSINQRIAASYTGHGWNLTANNIIGSQLDQLTNRPQISPCPVSQAFPGNGCNPNFYNLDLTATKRFGDWELGPVGFYSTDLSAPIPNYPKQRQFGAGWLVGYYFKHVLLQVYFTTDLYEKNYLANETRVWGHIVIPLSRPRKPVPIAH